MKPGSNRAWCLLAHRGCLVRFKSTDKADKSPTGVFLLLDIQAEPWKTAGNYSRHWPCLLLIGQNPAFDTRWDCRNTLVNSRNSTRQLIPADPSSWKKLSSDEMNEVLNSSELLIQETEIRRLFVCGMPHWHGIYDPDNVICMSCRDKQKLQPSSFFSALLNIVHTALGPRFAWKFYFLLEKIRNLSA